MALSLFAAIVAAFVLGMQTAVASREWYGFDK
jgi:hypothetical protein